MDFLLSLWSQQMSLGDIKPWVKKKKRRYVLQISRHVSFLKTIILSYNFVKCNISLPVLSPYIALYKVNFLLFFYFGDVPFFDREQPLEWSDNNKSYSDF